MDTRMHECGIGSLYERDVNISRIFKIQHTTNDTEWPCVKQRATGIRERASNASNTTKEISLKHYIMFMADRRFPSSREALCYACIDGKRPENERYFGNKRPSLMWLKGFKKRKPDLRLKSSESVMEQTVANARKDILSQHFELLEQILIKITWGSNLISFLIVTLTNVDLSPIRSSDIHLRAITQEIPQPSISKISVKIEYLKFHSNPPGANKLNVSVFGCDGTH